MKEILPLKPDLDSPAEIVKRATIQANLLMRIVEKQKLYVEIEGRRYMEVEGWQLIGGFTKTKAITEWVEPIKDKEEVKGYRAKVNLIRDGELIGSAIMPCFLTDFPCRGKDGLAKHRAAMSAAQTWAESKAYRMNYGFIASLAGFESTPVEEIIEVESEVKTSKITQKEWSRFWGQVYKSGLSKEAVYEILGVANFKEYADQGGTPDGAMKLIKVRF